MYPLYDKLVASKCNEIIDLFQLARTINGICNGDSKSSVAHYSEIYTLIIHYHELHDGKVEGNPYNSISMKGGKGVLINLDELPVDLQVILASYVAMYP